MSERLHPEIKECNGQRYLTPHDEHPLGFIVNLFLEEVGSRKRLRMISHDDGPPCACGIYTPEELREVDARLVKAPDRIGFIDPKRSKVVIGIQWALRLIG